MKPMNIMHKLSESYSDSETERNILELMDSIPAFTGKIEGSYLYLNEDKSKYISVVANEEGVEVSLVVNNTILGSQKIDFLELERLLKSM